MSAKIESSFKDGAAGPPEAAFYIPTQGGQSSDSLGEGGYDKAGDYTIVTNTILVQKLAINDGDIREVSSSEIKASKKH